MESDPLTELMRQYNADTPLGSFKWANLAVKIRETWQLVPHNQICPNPGNWPVHAPGHAARDCQACRDIVTGNVR